MLKLARNAFANGLMKDQQGNFISWSFVSQLFKVQQDEGRLTVAHVTEWRKRKMRVKLAAQVLSRSVADALEFLADIKHVGFAACEGTVKFIRVIDEVFDRLNARSPFVVGQKQAVTRANLVNVQLFFADAEKYLRGLVTADGQPLIESRLRTFVVGFISGMKAVVGLASDIFQESADVRYIIPYRLCQDSLEHMFGDVRARGGWCLKPTPYGFKFAYRALLHNKLRLCGLATGRNCVEVEDTTDDGLLPSRDHSVDLDEEGDKCQVLLSQLQADWPSELRSNMLYYMAGWAARQVERCQIYIKITRAYIIDNMSLFTGCKADQLPGVPASTIRRDAVQPCDGAFNVK